MLKNRMIEAGDVVCVGLSGGADSVCLLYFLLSLAKSLKIKVAAFHVNHMLRGRESDADEEFVRGLCEKLSVPLYVDRTDVAEYARKTKTGLEEAGRAVRRAAAWECRKKMNGTRVALAHNKNDCAETLLFHLARGSSVKGLGSIRPCTGDVIRPLLCLSRAEIEDELKALRVTYRTDSSNLSDDYTRNKIRHLILPVLENEVNAGAVDHIFAAAADLSEAADYLYAQAKEKETLYVTRISGNAAALSDALLKEMPALQKAIAKNVLEAAAGAARDISRVHVEGLLHLLRAQTGKRISFPYGLTGIKEYGQVVVEKSGDKALESPVFLDINGKTAFGGCVFTCSLIPKANFYENIREKTYTKYFDYDKILRNIVVRHRQAGDYFTVNEKGGHKKLSDYFTDKKLPQRQRDEAVVLASGQHIIWTVGMRTSEEFRITENTKCVLQIVCSRE